MQLMLDIYIQVGELYRLQVGGGWVTAFMT